MSDISILNSYSEWIVNTACDYLQEYGSYKELCSYLYSRPFFFLIDRDENRAEDGIAMRMRYIDFTEAHTKGFYKTVKKRCTVLEMMMALAMRAEDDIIFNSQEDNHVGALIHTMFVSMGVDALTDGRFDAGIAEAATDTMLYRRYFRNGKGGLFTIKDPEKDARDMEIWYQMQAYLNENY